MAYNVSYPSWLHGDTNLISAVLNICRVWCLQSTISTKFNNWRVQYINRVRVIVQCLQNCIYVESNICSIHHCCITRITNTFMEWIIVQPQCGWWIWFVFLCTTFIQSEFKCAQSLKLVVNSSLRFSICFLSLNGNPRI